MSAENRQNIVSFSTGISSAITVERVLERYGLENTTIVFMDTTIEDSDNYRFMADCQKRWPPIVVLSDGRDPYQVSKDVQIIPNQKIAPCTRVLKIAIFKDWLSNFDVPLTIHIGFDYSEVHRCKATKNAYEKKGYSVDFPLLWRPYETRPYTQVCREDWSIEPPRMYKLGYSHANCGGICVKQGRHDWTRTLLNFPERFAAIEQWESEMRKHPVRQNYALLRDQRGGKVTALTLKQVREEHESNAKINPSLFEHESPCISCGVGYVD